MAQSAATLRFSVVSVLVALTVLPAAVTVAFPQDVAEIDILGDLEWRPIGPAVMGGRIADIAAVDADTFYVAAATGNLWRTVNRGTTWEPLFEDESVNSIGAIGMAPSDPETLYLGTGEANNRQSSPWGAGVFRSTDGGRTWTHVGLDETRHVGRIIVHPRDPDVVYVAALGGLWGAGPERGVFRSTDGGITWDKVLYVDDDTGATDLAMDPGDPRTLYAAMYQRRRSACCFVGGGSGSGIWRSRDAGDTWVELSTGLPDGDLGRIGLDVFGGDGRLVYAIVEATGGASGVYRSQDRGEQWERVSDLNPRPMYYSQIRIDPTDASRVYVLGVGLHVSDDGGRTFHDDGASRIHSDHHAMWIDPGNREHLILGSDGGVSASFDRSATWRMLDNLPIGQFYEVGVDHGLPYHVYGGLQDNGSWGGPSDSRDRRGIRNADWFNVNGGDGFYTRVDPEDSSILFAESQNGSLQRLDLDTMERQSIRPRGGTDDDEYRFNWNAPIEISAHDRETIYFGANVLLRSRDRGLTWEEISADLTRQVDRDEELLMGIKPERGVLSVNDGVSSYGNITTLSESRVDAGLLYVGTDDGKLWRTRDGGTSWSDLTTDVLGVPERTYVSRVVASSHVPDRVYATFDGHFGDDFRPFVFVSEDAGDTWRSIVSGLPAWSVNVIAEHPRSANLLFLGTEFGVYVSLDAGSSWRRLDGSLPTVPVDDIVVHPRDNDLVIGTHGRSIWILDDITPLETLSGSVVEPAVLFPVRPAVQHVPYSPQGWVGDGEYSAPNPPYGARLRYWLAEDVAVEPDSNGSAGATISITDADGEPIRSLEGPGTHGLHEVVWDLRIEPPYEAEAGASRRGFRGSPAGPSVPPGVYGARLVAGALEVEAEVSVVLDPAIETDASAMEARRTLAMRAYALARPMNDADQAFRRLLGQLSDVRELVAGRDDVPEAVGEAVQQVGDELDVVREGLEEHRRSTYGARSIERSFAAPTEDQVMMLDEAWEAVPALIERLNAVITTGMPALNALLDEHGIRPDPGDPIAVPERQH